jgi:hypothetical protein
VSLLRRPLPPPRQAYRPSRIIAPPVASGGGGGGGTTAPTATSTADLAAGLGTRSFAAVTVAAGDYVVVQIIAETDTPSTPNTGMAVTATGLTFVNPVDTGTTVGGAHTRMWIFDAPDASGGSRTVTITPVDGGVQYHAFLTVVHGTNGPGNNASNKAAQTVSLTYSDHSMIFMGVGDWAAGAVGSPSWAPGGSTTASDTSAGRATYIFGRWNDSGTGSTASAGISSPSYTTPSVAVLEMLGTGSSGTSAPAEMAAATGIGGDASVATTATDTGPAATGAGEDATASVGANAEACAAAGVGLDTSVAVTVNAEAAQASRRTPTWLSLPAVPSTPPCCSVTTPRPKLPRRPALRSTPR